MVRQSLRSLIKSLRVSEMERLYFLNLLHGQRLVDLHDMVQGRVELSRKIRECAEDGYVGLVFGGIDCDGVQYEGRKSKIPTFEVFAEIDKAYATAEGPIRWYVCPVSHLSSVRYESYDLALSAFEEGHPATLYMR